jgi:polysaccharide biosynthesis protein PslJ
MSSAFDSVHSGRSGVTDLLSRQGEHGAATARLTDVPADETKQRRADAVTLLTCYLFLLMAIPAPLVLAPLGGAGGPATIFAALLLGCYLLTLIHPALALDRGPQPVRVAAVILTCAVIATYISANRRTLPGLEENGADRGLIIMFGWLGVMLLAADGIVSMDRLKTLLSRIIFGATAMATLAIVQFFTGLNAAQYIVIPGLTTQTPFTDLLTRDQLNRPSATAIDPIELAVVLAVCLVIAVHRARFAPDGRRGRRWAQVAIIAIALPMTVSRTGIVSLVVAGIVLLPTWPKWDRRAAYVAGLAGTAFLFATKPGLLGEFRSLFLQVGSDTSSASRTGAFSSSLPFIMQHPWLGRGFGTFLPATYFFTDDQFLLTLIETGIIGLAALLGLFITGWLTARRARRISKDPEVRDLGQTIAATVAIAAVSFATLDELSFAIAASLTFLIIGCSGALWRLVRAESLAAPATAGPPAPLAVSPAPAPAGRVNPVPAPAREVNPVPAPARAVSPSTGRLHPVTPLAEAKAPRAPERTAPPAEVPRPAATVTPDVKITPRAAAATPPGVTTPAEVLPRPGAAMPPAEDVGPPAATTPPGPAPVTPPAERGPAPEATPSPAAADRPSAASAPSAEAGPPAETPAPLPATLVPPAEASASPAGTSSPPAEASRPAETPAPLPATLVPPAEAGPLTWAVVPLPATLVPSEGGPSAEAATPSAEASSTPESTARQAEPGSPSDVAAQEAGAIAREAGAGPAPDAAPREAEASPPPGAAPSPPTSWAFTPARPTQPAPPEAAPSASPPPAPWPPAAPEPDTPASPHAARSWPPPATAAPGTETPASPPPARTWPPPAAAPWPEVAAQEPAPSAPPAEEAPATVFPAPASSADHAAGADQERAGAERGRTDGREDDTIPIPVIRDDPAPPAE